MGFVNSTESCGGVDGPGIRFVVFTQGCPLRCQYCQNPETQGKPCGKPTTAGQIVDQALRYKRYLRRGGITVSGGEPLLQPQFTEAVFRLAKENGLHTALDTSGFLGDKASDEMLDHVDLVLLDIKSGLQHIYKRTTNVRLGPTLKFARRLDERGTPMWIRFVLVPGLTDAAENIDAVAEFTASLEHVERVEILPFHNMAASKYTTAGLPYELADTPSPGEDEIQRARDIFARHGISAI